MLDFNVIIRDVRSFAGRHSIPVKPLTIAVGENSSGKSTFLAVLSTLLDPNSFPFRPALTDTPYDLGGFENVLTSIRRRGQRPRDFALGFSRTAQGNAFDAVATYSGARGQIQASQFLLNATNGMVELKATNDEISGLLRLKPDATHPDEFDVDFSFDAPFPVTDFFSLVMNGVYRWSAQKRDRPQFQTYQDRIFQLFGSTMLSVQQHGYSLAPIRTKPRRTYDQVTESFTPEGDHILIRLSRIFGDQEHNDQRTALQDALAKFGTDSGLFNGVGVRRLGRDASDPFQVRVAMPGRASNLADVGYGVSQALPVIVESIISSQSQTLLLQQPEVHLHPRAQAALGTFFVNLVDRTNELYSGHAILRDGSA